MRNKQRHALEEHEQVCLLIPHLFIEGKFKYSNTHNEIENNYA